MQKKGRNRNRKILSPEFCSRAKGHCDVAVVVVTIEPIQLSDLTCPSERCPVVTMELQSKIEFSVWSV